MLTPSNMASTSGVGHPAPSAASISRVAGMLLITLAITADTAATSSRSSRPVPLGRNSASREPSAPSAIPTTSTPRANTKARNPAFADRAISTTEVLRARIANAAITVAPRTANHTGSIPITELSPNSNSVAASTARAAAGAGPGSSVCSGRGRVSRSSRKYQQNSTYSTVTITSHGSAISKVNSTKPRPVAANASRLVRFDTGISVDAEFARVREA